MRSALFTTLLLAAAAGYAQQFQRLYSGENDLYGHSIIQRADGGFASCGAWYHNLAGFDGYQLRTDQNGDFEGMMRYSVSNGYLQLNDIEQTPDAGFIMAGFMDTGTLMYMALLIKTDDDGNIMWSRVISGGTDDQFKDVVQTSDGGYLAIGTTTSFGNGGMDALIVKFNSGGTVIWSKAAGTGSQDAAYGGIQMADGGFAIAGRTYNAIPQLQGGPPRSNNDNFYMLRLDGFGNRVWGRATGDFGSDGATDVIQLAAGPLVFSGSSEHYSGSTSYNAALVGVLLNGGHMWTKLYDFDSSYNHGSDIIYSPKEIAVIGLTDKDSADGASSGNPMLFKTNEAGDLQWAQLYGSPIDVDDAYGLYRTSDFGYVMTGYTDGFGLSDADEYFIKTDADGASGCNDPITLTVIDTTLLYGDVGDSVIDLPSVTGLTYTINEEPYTPWDSVLCMIVGLQPVPEDHGLEVFPNPASDFMYVAWRDGLDHVELVDLTGKLVQQHTGRCASVILHLQGVLPGIYLVRAIDRNGRVHARACVVE
jgi:hypothetical protein